MFYTYILKSKISSRYYIGSTNNLENRIERHNKGYVRSTKPFRPWKVIHTEKFKSLLESRRREKQIKGWKSRKAIERLFTAPFV